MSKMFKIILVSVSLLALFLLLQSTILGYIAIDDVKPDISLIILVFISLKTGNMIGQISGFSIGLIEDFISLPPLGFYALIRTILGYVFGLFAGTFSIDPILVPMLFVLVATLLKNIMIWIFTPMFSITSLGLIFFGSKFWIEIAYNCILAPIVFALLNIITIFKQTEKKLINGRIH